jgi:hypothetical protein
MNFRKFRNAWKVSLGIGIGFLILGVYWFMNSGSGTPQEKIGTVFMMYSSIFIGIAFTIYVTLKSQS